MVELMTRKLFVTTAVRHNGGWLLATNVHDVGMIHAFADTDEDIDLMIRQNICSFKNFQPFDFDIHVDFPGEKPSIDR